jgi:nucleotide-binding universal stress UspA family protein
MRSRARRILVTLDGSEHALDTVRYLCQVLPTEGVELVLFSLLNREPEYDLDTIEGSPAAQPSAVTSRWRVEQRNSIEKFMEDARLLLVDRGFPADGLKVKVEERKVGIARDIIREAQEGYDAVVAGRQGTNPITRLVIGSIASKLLQSLTFVPLWLVGKTKPNNKILVALDASEGAARAVEHVGKMLSGTDFDLTLLRVVRSTGSQLSGKGDGAALAADRDDSESGVDSDAFSHEIFGRAAKILLEAGFSQDRITAKVISGVATRSGSIIAQATAGGYGTIVMGRRGHSRVGEFSMGRVTNKVIQLAGRVAVWVVN